MASTKANLSAFEVEMKRRQADERRLNKPSGSGIKASDSKRKSLPKSGKVKTGGKNTPAAKKTPPPPPPPPSKKPKLQAKKKNNNVITKRASERVKVRERTGLVDDDDDEDEDEEDESVESSSEEEDSSASESDVQMNGPTGTDSVKDGEDAFRWLIAPVKIEDFFKNAWEKAPLHVKRADFPDYYKGILTSPKIHDILRDNHIMFGKNIDITKYSNGERVTLNPVGRAIHNVVWDFYKKGCSVRMLNPQTYCLELRKLSAMLQEFFGCLVGCNSYLTPVNSQGFAPHYDDIEAFILQVEGKKHWKVYAPRKPEEVLPIYPSPNLTESDLPKPVLEVTLQPGDLLYFPRGFIHQASTEPGHHSLHLTVSCYQKNTWGDLLDKLLPAALAVAQEDDIEYRKGLPLDYLRYLGVSNSELDSAKRSSLLNQLHSLFVRLLEHAPIDAAADQLGKQFMHDALPPVLSPEEEKCSVFSENTVSLQTNGGTAGNLLLNENTKIKLLRFHILRLVKEDDTNEDVQVYHCIDNSVEYHAEDPQMFDVNAEFAMGIEQLIHAYPKFISVSELRLDSKKDKLELANMLWKKGLLLTDKPLKKSHN